MFNRDKPTLKTLKDDAIANAYVLDPASDDYTTIIKNLETLEGIGTSRSRYTRVTPDAIVGAVSSLTGILCVLHYEQLHPVASKAFGLITKIRI